MDRRKLVCVDLFSGLGGFSEAFVERGHEVIRIDNDPRFKDIPHTIIADVRELPLERNLNPDILLMSPPCNHFSVASVYRHWNEGIPKHDGTVLALRLVAYALDAVDDLEPRYWVLENPRGMLRTILGKPKITTYMASWGALYLKPTDLWGRFPPEMVWPKPETWESAPRGSKQGTQGIHKGAGCGKGGKDERPSTAALRAKIPYKLSESFAIAVENVQLPHLLER